MIDQSDSQQLISRRLFMIAGTAMLSASLPARAQEAPAFNAAQRMEMLHQMTALIDSGSTVEDRRAQIEKLPALIDCYRAAIVGANDVSAEELHKAVEINRIKINMPHYSSGIEGGVAAKFLVEHSIKFYDDLITALEACPRLYTGDQEKIQSAIVITRGDLCWSQAHHLSAVNDAVKEVLINRFLNPKYCTNTSELRGILNFPAENYRFQIGALEKNLDYIGVLISRETCQASSKPHRDPQSNLESTLELVEQLHQLIHISAVTESIPESARIVWEQRLWSTIDQSVFDQLVPIALAIHRKPLPVVPFFMEQMIPGQTPRAIPAKTDNVYPAQVHTFLNSISQSRVELGERFVSAYECEFQHTIFSPQDRLKVASLLISLSPKPELKQSVIDDLRVILTNNRQEISDKHFAWLLSSFLFADHTFAAAVENKSFSAAASVQRTIQLMGNCTPLYSQDCAITPAERLFVEIARVATGVDPISTSLLGMGNNAEQKAAIQTRCREILNCVIQDIYELCSHTTVDGTTTSVHLPKSWVNGDGSFTEAARGQQLAGALSHFIALADGAIVRLVEFNIESGEKELIERLTFVTDVLDIRVQSKTFPFQANANPVARIRELFPPPAAEDVTGPFASVRNKARMILTSRKSKDVSEEALDRIAVEYAKATEERFLCSFALHLWGHDGERPIESHRLLSPHRMAGVVRQILADYGFHDRYLELQGILEKGEDKCEAQLIERRTQIGVTQSRLLDEMQRIVGR